MIWRKQNQRVRWTIPSWIQAKDSEIKFTWLWSFAPNSKPNMNCCKRSVAVNRAVGIRLGVNWHSTHRKCIFKRVAFFSETVPQKKSARIHTCAVSRDPVFMFTAWQKSLKQLWDHKHKSAHNAVIKWTCGTKVCCTLFFLLLWRFWGTLIDSDNKKDAKISWEDLVSSLGFFAVFFSIPFAIYSPF